MLGRVLEFTRALRVAGIPVVVSESIDAMTAVRHSGLSDPRVLKATLAATMIKDQTHMPAFETLFELYFRSTGRTDGSRGNADEGTGPDAAPELDVDRLQELLYDALLAGDAAGMNGLVKQAVESLGRLDSSRDWFSNYEVVRALDVSGLARRLVDHVDMLEVSALERRLLASEFESRVRMLRSEIIAETRRRVAELRGPEAVAGYAVAPLPEDQSFLGMTSDMDDIRRAVRPLARKLATRLAMKRRKAKKGQLDIRRTFRRSLSTGGVPFRTAHRHRAPHRPELFVLCDVSGSVARFARFGLMLTHALGAQFSRVRSFAFVDTLDEVTRFFEHEDFFAAVDLMNREARLVWDDGHSDYGTALDRFYADHGRDLSPKATLLILGDARNNYRAKKEDVLKEMASKVHHTYWLNPEPISDWDTGDSVASAYAAQVDKMVEVRNLKQLEEFIALEL